MLWVFIVQIALMGQRHGAPKNMELDQWYFPVEKIHMQESQLMLKTDEGKAFGEPALFIGKCEGATTLIRKDNCNIYYHSSLSGIKKGVLQFIVRGEGRFRISVYSSAGFVSTEVNLSEDPDTITIDLSKSVAITQHGGTDPLRIVFSPLTDSFRLEVSNFVLKEEE